MSTTPQKRATQHVPFSPRPKAPSPRTPKTPGAASPTKRGARTAGPGRFSRAGVQLTKAGVAFGDAFKALGQAVGALVTAPPASSAKAQFHTVVIGSENPVKVGAVTAVVAALKVALPAAGFAVNLSTGANAVDTAEAVREVVGNLSSALPEGVVVEYPYDTSPFVEESIDQVYETLLEAIVLVFLVIFLFLQSWRATIIPTIAVPVQPPVQQQRRAQLRPRTGNPTAQTAQPQPLSSKLWMRGAGFGPQ